MHKIIRSAIFFSLCFSVLGTPSFAADKEKKDNQYALSESAYKQLSSIQKLIDEDRQQEAITQLKVLLPNLQGNAYEAAVAQQTLGYAYYNTDRFDEAAKAFKLALKDNALPPDVTHNLTFNLTQLLASTENYQEAIDYLQRWLKQQPKVSLDGHKLAANVYYQAEHFQSAIAHAQKVIALQGNVEENWYQLLLSCYYQTSQFTNAANLLQTMVHSFPGKKSYWMQWVGAYQQANKDKRALGVLELAYKHGVLEAKEILQLAQMYLYLEMPYKAAHLMEREMSQGRLSADNTKHLKTLRDCWLLARERDKTITVLTKLAQRTGSADNYYQLGQIYFDMERWDESIHALKAAAATSKFHRAGEARLLVGIAYYRLGNQQLSTLAFEQALSHTNSRTQAEWWLDKLRGELANAS